MNRSTPIADELLAKYVAGEADAAECTQVETWASASEANAAELECMRVLWSWSDTNGQAEVDVDAAWKNLGDRVANEEGGHVIPLRSWRPRRWLATAAVIAIALVARWWSAGDDYSTTTAYQRTVLEDSSSVVLSPSSSMSVRFGDTRAVQLDGEAYFEVEHDAQRPFVIEAGDVQVTVLGTAFTVNAFDTARTVLVRVREGRVQLVAGKDSLVLVAGEHALYDKDRHFLQREAASPTEVWGERTIHFADAPMPQVVERLQRLFNVGIELQNGPIANCRLTATFEDEPVERILTVIAETYGLVLTRNSDGNYELDGAGCP